MGSPIVIFTQYHKMISGGFDGLMQAVSFTCMLNVNLAIINLLPIPVLDGGLILFALLELLRRKPVGRKAMSALTNAFAMLLIAVFVLLMFRDAKWETPEGSMARRLFNRVDRVVFGAAPSNDPAVAGTNAPAVHAGHTNEAVSPQTTP